MLRSIKYGLYGAILAGLIAVPVVWSTTSKSVRLVVDGQATTISTTDARVGDVLRDHGYRLTAHDIVAPTADTQLANGMHVVLRRGRLLHLSVDGRPHQVWTTAPTVAVAMDQLGYPTADYVSVSRSRRLPLSPMSIAIRTPRVVTVMHDGQADRVTTTDATVGQLFTDLGITVGAKDRLSAAPTSALTPGESIRLQRVGEKTLTRVETLDFATKRTADPDLAQGKTKIASKGKAGKARVTYAVTYVDGKAVSRQRVHAITLADPRNKVIAVGTKPVVQRDVAQDTEQAPTPTPGSAKAIAQQLLAQRGWGDDQFSCLVQMWDRESGWSTSAANPSGAYGIPQALPGSKMASAGPDWQTDAETQIKWGIGYIAARYNTPCGAWGFWQAHGYY